MNQLDKLCCTHQINPNSEHFEVITAFSRFNNNWQFSNAHFRLDDLSGTAGLMQDQFKPLISNQFDYKHDVMLDVKARSESGKTVRDLPNMVTIPTKEYTYMLGSSFNNDIKCRNNFGKINILDGWLGKDNYFVTLDCHDLAVIPSFNMYQADANIIYLDSLIRNSYYIVPVNDTKVEIHSEYDSLNGIPSGFRVEVNGKIGDFKEPGALNNGKIIRYTN